MILQVTVDSVENGQARLLIRPTETQELLWPVKYLPPEIQDGDILSIEINRDESETDQAKSRVKDLLERLAEKNRQ